MFEKLLAMLGMSPKKQTSVSTEHAHTEVVETPKQENTQPNTQQDHKCHCGVAGCDCEEGQCNCH